MLCACFRFVCAYCGATKLHELDKRTDSLNTYALTSFANILTCMGDFCSAVPNSKWQQVGKALVWHISGFVLVDSEDAVTFELILSNVDTGPTKGSRHVFISSNSGWFCDMRAHSLNWLPPAPNPPLPTHPTTRSLSLSLLSPLQFSIMPHRFYTQSTFAMTRLWGNPIPPSCFQNLLSTGTHFLSLTLSHSHTRTHHHLHKLVREQITCILSVIPRTLPAALHRSPFEEQPCDFSLFCPAGPFAFCEGFWSWILKLCMAAACAYQRVHKWHANQTRITHRIGGLHSKASLIANWVSRCETHTANEKQECGCFKASGWTN